MVTSWVMVGKPLSREIVCGSEPGSRLKLIVKGEQELSAFDSMIAARRLQKVLPVAVSQMPSPGVASGSSPESLTVSVVGQTPFPATANSYGFSSTSSLAMLIVAVAGAKVEGAYLTTKVVLPLG